MQTEHEPAKEVEAMASQHDEGSVWVKLVRWLARAMSLVSIALLALFLTGHDGLKPGTVTGREWIGLLFFPLGVAVGMAVAWKYEAWGSLLSIGSLAGFYVVYGFILSGAPPRGWAFAAFTAPAFLFLLSWLIGRRLKRTDRGPFPLTQIP
jgi:hypothetical protein